MKFFDKHLVQRYSRGHYYNHINLIVMAIFNMSKGLCNILDGIIKVLSFGLLYSCFAFKTEFFIRKYASKRRK